MSFSASYQAVERGPYQTVTISIKPNVKGGSNVQEIFIDDLVAVRFQFIQRPTPKNPNSVPVQSGSARTSQSATEYSNTPKPVYAAMSYKKIYLRDDLRVKLNIQLKAFKYSAQVICQDKWTEWINLGCIVTQFKSNSSSYKHFEIKANLIVSKAEVVTFSKLYDDTITSDFNISVKGSSHVVSMHRNCLLAHSDMFKTLFQSGDFVDKKDFEVGIKEVTDQTIQHLKDYVYLGKLPDTGLRPLLLLAKCYLFENLKSECITKMVETVTYKDLHGLVDFACENNIPELMISLLQVTPAEVINRAHNMEKNRGNDAGSEDGVRNKRARYETSADSVDLDNVVPIIPRLYRQRNDS